MGTAFMAALAAVLGVAIGRFWDTRSESVRWRRDQKTASYQGFAEQFQTVNEVLRALAIADPADQTYHADVEHIRLVEFKGWDSAYTTVWLHGSPSVVAVASQLDQAVTRLFYEVGGRRLTIEEWQEARIPARYTFEQFIAAVRAELRLQPVPAKFFPDTPDELPMNPVP